MDGGADWAFAWWKNDARRFCWRVCGGSLGVRKYIGRTSAGSPFAGHQWGRTPRCSPTTSRPTAAATLPGSRAAPCGRAGYAFGLEYGYSLPVGRRLSIDFAAGVGYMGGKYHEYLTADGCAVRQKTSRRRWFGPTKAEVSLVWTLGGFGRRGKGGRR